MDDQGEPIAETRRRDEEPQKSAAKWTRFAAGERADVRQSQAFFRNHRLQNGSSFCRRQTKLQQVDWEIGRVFIDSTLGGVSARSITGPFG